jgi:hypothetical protein
MKKYKILNRSPKISHACVHFGFKKRLPTQLNFFLMEELYQKDYPSCPYLLTTSWQYGDSKEGGWIYDNSLQVSTTTEGR